MSEENLDTHLSTTVDEFEQFQSATTVEEEEFITLSDLVSPEPSLPGEVQDIPFDSEVVLSSNFDDQNSDALPVVIDNSQNADDTSHVDNVSSEPVIAESSDQTEQHLESVISHDNNVSVEHAAESNIDTNTGRSKRARKPKKYPELIEVNLQPTKTRRGRKPKQSLTMENDSIQPDTTVSDESLLSQTNATPKRGRKMATDIKKPLPDLTLEKPTRRRRLKQNTCLEETTLPPAEQQIEPEEKQAVNNVSEENNSASELFNEHLGDLHAKPTKASGGRGRRKKSLAPNNTSNDLELEQNEQPNNEPDIVPSKSNKKRRGRQKKSSKKGNAKPDNQNMVESDDELDNLTLQALSNRNSDSDTKINGSSIYCGVNQIRHLESNDPAYDELSKVQEFLENNFEKFDMDTEPQDMELDETVDSQKIPILDTIETQNMPVKVEVLEDRRQDLINSVENEDLSENCIKHEREVKLDSELKLENDIRDEKCDPNETTDNSLLVEDSSKRPRRRTKKILKYDEESDEDPFANIELSDDEPSNKRKRKYNEDDEYIPEKEFKRGITKVQSISESEDSDISDLEELEINEGGKRGRKGSHRTPVKRKRNNKSQSQYTSKDDIQSSSKDVNVTTITPKIDVVDDPDDIEVCLQSSVIHANKDGITSSSSGNAWANPNAFENFIAQKIQGTNIKIKKVSSNEFSQSAPLEIPVLDPEAKKSVEAGVQTNVVKIANIGVQTTSKYEAPMKNNVQLSTEQAEQSCEFLRSIVKTTSELGQLMTEKSEDFISKKIHTGHVTDTFKMDYCVRKSFLLLKLAKTNIVQMEEDLSKQYEEFLKRTDLLKHREEEKIITAAEKKDSDSDCEIVEEPIAHSSKQKPKFNPKTVFLNKELSIKIAKKPVENPVEKKCRQLNIKNKRSVWINDSVMVKKVKPTQSFLAQDSRNKKPPDCYVTEEMVSNFFKNYYLKLAPSICAPFTSTEWLGLNKSYMCSYFFVKPDKFDGASSSLHDNEEICLNSSAKVNVSENKTSDETCVSSPTSLVSLCVETLRNYMDIQNSEAFEKRKTPCTLFRLCVKFLTNTFRVDLHTTNEYIENDCEQKSICVPLYETNEKNSILKEKYMADSSTTCEIANSYENQELPVTLENSLSCGTTNEIVNYYEHQVLPLKKLCYIHLFGVFFGNNLDSNEVFKLSNQPEDVLDRWNNSKKNCILPKCHYDETSQDEYFLTEVLSLKEICYSKITELIYASKMKSYVPSTQDVASEKDLLPFDDFNNSDTGSNLEDMLQELDSFVNQSQVKSLFSMCVFLLQNVISVPKKAAKINSDAKEYFTSEHFIPVQERDDLQLLENVQTLPTKQVPDSLKRISFEFVRNIVCKKFDENKNIIHFNKVQRVKRLADLCFEIVAAYTTDNSVPDQTEPTPGLSINCVNTVSEDVFHNMDEDDVENEDDNFYDDDFGDDYGPFEENETEESNWVSQLKLQVQQDVNSVLTMDKDSFENQTSEENTAQTKDMLEDPLPVHVKQEPLDELSEVAPDSTIIKAEPLHPAEIEDLPATVNLKQEGYNDIEPPNERGRLESNSSYDVNSFENFVRMNKMMHALDEPEDEIFNQTGHRQRRQHEPDYMNEYDPSLNLLVPQTFEPISIENAKGVLMENSSDEDSSKSSGHKKVEKKGKGRTKKGGKPQRAMPEKSPAVKEKPLPSKEKVPPATPSVSEVAILTRRMREKIRQEEKKVASSDSESENLPLSRRKDKESAKSTKAKISEDEIQCNAVDSTEKTDNLNESPDNTNKFPGFTAVDQNEITSYQKYVKFVYDKIIPKDSPQASPNVPECSSNVPDNMENDDRSQSPLINYDEPAEMLECIPSMPIFDEDSNIKSKKGQSKTKSKTFKDKKTEVVSKESANPDKTDDSENSIASKKPAETHVSAIPEVESTPIYTERDGWHCYPIQPNETKLYHTTALILDKLPEEFVETYFRYQQINHTRKEDQELDRLINLNTLNNSRAAVKDGRKMKSKGKSSSSEIASGQPSDVSRPGTPHSEGRAELTASEDEGANVDDELPPPVPSRHSNENHLAKNSLMGESDEEHPNIKKEIDDEGSPEKHRQSKRKSKTTEEPVDPENLMLTADKMMNKELNLLHAPVVLSNDLQKEAKESASKSKNKRESKRNRSRDHVKNEEDSSSEEEKQWVNTKEKLLKRMKKPGTTSADDAKRAKLVCDFIERRGDGGDSRKLKKPHRRRGRSSRKILEREKQMRVLQHEMLGMPLDPAMTGPRHKQFSQSVFKGRRNIRKVIDKKSLARSTVIANMEEFERKCRLNERQAQLRELLGCEEGVNVLVINDEVCLEYGFEEQRPLVTVHSFFTRVMKAHQYEGVKFMWDACFETLDKVASGHPGGGCILAHCMGLGKTLQVLALLHTVLTHPRVGMQRVLVCCPLSTVLNWVDEIHKWIGPVTDRIKVFELSKLKKTYERAYQLEDWYSGGGIFIIGYELFRSLTTLDPEFDDVRPTIVNKIRTALLDPGPDIIVCDEGHLLKNDCSVLAVAMSRVATKRRIVLTGTPMQNNLREYYCMVNFIKPNLLGTYSEYSNRFENPIMNGQHRDSREEDIKLMKQRTHILHKVLEGCLQRQEASVLYPYLPKKHEYTVFISLTQVQWDLYKHYINNYSHTATKQSVLKDFHILQKIWSHPQVLDNFQTKKRDQALNMIKPEKLEDDLAHEDLAASEDVKPLETDEKWWLQYQRDQDILNCLESSNKFVVVFKILDECIALGDKVLIFSTSLFTMDSLEFFLKKINKWNLGQEYYRLDGSVPAEVRQKWCREFNAEHNLKTKLFLISTRAGSLGLNMVAANRVIILDTSWNPAHDIQSIFRVYRFGQKKDCYIYRLVALGTMEQKIYERSVTKQAVACRVVDEQQIDRHYNMAELTELYRYDEEGTSVASGVAVGVEDVALLRVARLPALHAVHEHDSLLRGSSEQQLPEHERAAAWMQFQQEHATKQMQNHLTSSFSLHLPLALSPHSVVPNGMMVNIPNQDNLQIPEIKQETPDPPKPEPTNKKGRSKKSDSNPNLTPDQKNDADYEPYSRRGRKKGKEAEATYIGHIPPEALPPQTKEAKEIEENMVKKIMDLLVKHNFQKRQGPKDIAELVSTVRKMVAYGKVPEGSFDSALAKSIADVLLLKENVEVKSSSLQLRKRGRPRKTASNESSDQSEPVTPQPSTSQFEFESNAFPGRRRAAINAEKQIDSLTSIIADPDGDAREDDWQADDSGGEEFVPHTSPRKEIKQEKTEKVRGTSLITNFTVTAGKPKTQQKKPAQVNTEDSIVLSDDDEPAPKPKTYKPKPKSKKLAEEKPTEPPPPPKPEEPVPLHPSLLSNKNFIKIVAHTYLEGNPMLDEDAATLAAQYSTLKAKKEIESTGKPIVSGPIYDIAIKVLGIDILKKLQKPGKVAAMAIKTEPETAPAEKPDTKSNKPKVTAKPSVTTEQETTRKPGPRLKARRINELTESEAAIPKRASPAPAATPPPLPTAMPYVVPVGLINRIAGIAPSEPFAPLAPPEAEESILPDDDDVIINDILPENAVTKPNLFKKNAKPLILESVKAKTIGKAQEPIPKLVISAGKLMPLGKVQEKPEPPPPVRTTRSRAPPPQAPANEPICLDSDEEDTAPKPPPPITTRKVALKSTAKQAAAAPVPVSLTATNPKLNALLNQPSVPPQPTSSHVTPQNLIPLNPTSNTNRLLIPGNKLRKLPPGVIPAGALKNVATNPGMSSQSILPIPTPIPESVTYIQPNMYQQQPQMFQQQPQMFQQQPQMFQQQPQMFQQQPQMYQQQQQTFQQQSQMYQQQPQTFQQQSQMYQQPSMVIGPDMSINNKRPQAPQPPANATKTVCKPGDILRITETGQVEVLTKEQAQAAVSRETTNPEPKPPELLKPRAGPKSRTRKALAEDTKVPSPAPAETITSDRIRKISSSSSSSEDSRPSTPEDPLSCLKDVVHIKAPEDTDAMKHMGIIKQVTVNRPKPTHSKAIPPKIVTHDKTKSSSTSGSTNKSVSTSKTTALSGKATVTASGVFSKAATKANTTSKSNTSLLLPSNSKKIATRANKSFDDVAKHVQDTDTILKKLDKSLGSSTSIGKSGPSQNRKVFDTIDLDDDTPIVSSATKRVYESKFSAQQTKNIDSSKKVVGTGKDIIISMTGKSPSLSTTNSAKKITITNVEKIPSPATKRPAPTPAPIAKKKKTENMTLKDFNIDDIDDIIELD